MIEHLELKDFPVEPGAFDPSQGVSVQRFELGVTTPRVSFVIPVYNQQTRIGQCLDSIRSCATLPHDIVILLDGCTDGSESVVNAWITEARERPQLTSRITLTTTSQGLFETMTDSIGIALSSAPYIIEVQADMQIEQVGFDGLMTSALRTIPGLVMLSGRGGHALTAPFPGQAPNRFKATLDKITRRLVDVITRVTGAYRPTVLEYLLSGGIGRTGNRIEAQVSRTRRTHVYVAQSVMRGPLAFARDTWDAMGGFDTSRFFLGDDDHDFAYRASRRGWSVGYLPIAFSSPLDSGSTRAEKSPQEQREFARLRHHYAASQLDIASREPVIAVRKRRYRLR